MKNLIYAFLLMILPIISFASNTEFSYDKSALVAEFNQIDLIANFVDETKASITEVNNSTIFKGNIELTNAIAVKPNLKFEDVDWGSFAWGFCCWPIGIFTVVLNDDKDKDSKHSFLAGIASSVIATGILYIGIYAYAIASGGIFF